MIGLNYERLTRTMNVTPPYRGSKNRFPLMTRRQNNKYFLVRDEDGKPVFDIVYGKRWTTHTCDKDTYDQKIAEGARAHGYPVYDNKGNPTGAFEYYWYEVQPNILGTVRSDNTFEFNANVYHQGERGFLSQFSHGWFTTDSRRGGMVYKEGWNNVSRIVPIWKGMRIDVSAMIPTESYKTVVHHVDRKKGKQLLSGYERFFKVSEVMLKSLTMEMIVQTAREVVGEVFNDTEAHSRWHKSDEYLAAAKERMESAPLDAFVLYALGYDIGRFAYMMRWKVTNFNYESESVEVLFASTKRKLSKELYKVNRDVFKEVEYEGGKPYPACDWGVKIIVDGKEMVQL